MAEKIQFGNVVNATVQVNNTGYTKRVFNISADVTIENKKVTSINNGQIADKSNGNQIGYFNANGYGYLNIAFNDTNTLTTEKQIEVLTSANDFIADTMSAVASESATDTVLPV